MAVTSPRAAAGGSHRTERLVRLGLSPDRWDYLVALAGNPSVGKSTAFNQLTGLRQHTGTWPGKTFVRAEGVVLHDDKRVKIVDLPGTYSLQAGRVDEEVARDLILFGRPAVTVVIVDATVLERNLNLVLQVLEIADRVVVFLNLMDEARRHGIAVDSKQLSSHLGVPVVPGVARKGEGIDELLAMVSKVAKGEIITTPRRIERHRAAVEAAIASLVPSIQTAYPDLPTARRATRPPWSLWKNVHRARSASPRPETRGSRITWINFWGSGQDAVDRCEPQAIVYQRFTSALPRQGIGGMCSGETNGTSRCRD